MEPLVLDDVVVRAISVSDMENNVYLITSRSTGEQVLIDAADDAGAIAGLVESASGDAAGGDATAGNAGGADGAWTGPGTVLTTHHHWDHVRALAEVVESHGATTVAGRDDAEAIAGEKGGTRIDRTVEHGDVLEFSGFALECIHLRGHTPGSIAYVLRDTSGTTVLFSGDSLFPGGPGKTWKSEDFDSLMVDLQERVFGTLPDDAIVLPGHGAGTTIGAERPSIPEWLARGW